MTNALELRGIDKRCGTTQANRGVDLIVRAGTVHAIVGENGAGKSTLMKIAYGTVQADAGRIVLRGEEVARTRHRPAVAIARAVGMVHQHFMLVPSLTVAENLVLGHEPTRRWGPGPRTIDLARATREIAALAERVGLPVDPSRRVEALSVGEQQRVEVLRVLWLGAEVLILDEPTAVLTPGEVKTLFDALRRLVAEGRTIIIVTHKLDEVRALADRVTVLRKGEVVAELPGDAAPEDIARAMVGRPVLLSPVPMGTAGEAAATVLEVRDLVVAAAGRRAVDGVSLTVKAGEIVGVAGVEGNGQTELVEALAGVRSYQGQVRLGGAALDRMPVAARHRAGLGWVPDDRHGRGLVLDGSLADNLHLGRLDEVRGRFGLDRRAMRARAVAMLAEYGVSPADPDAQARQLSGGNQQKLVVARELGRPGLRCLLAAQPTRGVDVGAIELIDQKLVAARDRGVGVLLVSAELSELRTLADRVLVLHRGRVVAEVAGAALGDEATVERVGALMVGASV